MTDMKQGLLAEHVGAGDCMIATDQVTLIIEGMRCATCAGRIEQTLRCRAGVLDARVSFATRRAVIAYDGDATTVDALCQAIEAVG